MSKKFLSFAGLKFKGLQAADLFPRSGEFKFIVTVNADLVVISSREERFANLISKNFSTIDGQITLWLAKLFGMPNGIFFEKISGSSFAYDLLQSAAEEKMRVFLLGASYSVNKLAVSNARERYGVDVNGFSPVIEDYPFSNAWNDEALSCIKAHQPHILLVALGSPKQEYWIEDNSKELEALGVQVVMGCGGTLDFMAGAIPRAPVWVQEIGLESLYRLAMQPSWFRVKRLARSLLVFPLAFWGYFFFRRNKSKA